MRSFIKKLGRIIDNKKKFKYSLDADGSEVFKNSLILCNDDVMFIGIFCAIHIIEDIYKIPLTIVANENSVTLELKKIFPKRDIIFTGGSVNTIIQKLEEGRSVIIFYSFDTHKVLEGSTSIKHITKNTKCPVVYMNQTFNFGIENNSFYQKYCARTQNIIDSTIPLKKYLAYNYIFLFKFFFKPEINLNIRTTKITGKADYSKYHDFIKSIFM